MSFEIEGYSCTIVIVRETLCHRQYIEYIYGLHLCKTQHTQKNCETVPVTTAAFFRRAVYSGTRPNYYFKLTEAKTEYPDILTHKMAAAQDSF